MIYWADFFPEANLWNSAKDFQLKYEDMNLVLGKRAPESQQDSNRKCMYLLKYLNVQVYNASRIVHK
jgi:hypothetical protein